MPLMRKRGARTGIGLVVLLLSTGILGATSSCHREEGQQLEKPLEAFCTSYFNWRFQQAVPYCTDASQRWLRYAASQVNSSDVERLRAQQEGATFTLGDISYNEGGDSAWVEVTVNNFLQMDTLGKAAQPMDEAHYQVPMVRQKGQWRVTLSGLLRQR